MLALFIDASFALVTVPAVVLIVCVSLCGDVHTPEEARSVGSPLGLSQGDGKLPTMGAGNLTRVHSMLS